MRKVILHLVKAALPVIAGIISTITLPQTISGQQFVVADKDNTHPEQTLQQPSIMASFTADRYDGYNEIRWTTARQDNVRKFIIEYSMDGINYQSAGESLLSTTPYVIKHYLTDDHPVLYRIKTESLNGRFYYSKNIALDGIEVSPVKVYPTIVSGNMINVNASWPVERLSIVSTTGTPSFTKEISGQKDYMRVNIPSLAKGMYLVTFYGDGWQSTSKILVP